MLDQPKLQRTLARVGELAVAGDYEALERLTKGRRLAAEELREAVNDYGRRLVSPPEGGWTGRSIVEIEGAEPESWSVYVDLWTVEEGRSDLTLELTIRETAGDLYDVEIENLHVL